MLAEHGMYALYHLVAGFNGARKAIRAVGGQQVVECVMGRHRGKVQRKVDARIADYARDLEGRLSRSA